MMRSGIRLVAVVGCMALGVLQAAGETVTSVAAGYMHTCALTTTGGVLCWGGNEDGELGDGTTTDRWTPGAVSGLADGVTAIAVGTRHTCALTTDGAVLCWGNNEVGQLGDGTATNRLTPAPVSGLDSGVAAIAAGGWHTCALTTGGGVVCWGLNIVGELGDGTTTDRWTPTAVSGLDSGIASVSGGNLHTCALTTGGGVTCWGYNSDGQLGDGTTTERWTPTAVTGLGSGVAGIAAGSYHTCALTTGGGALCWGYNDLGQVGDGTWMDRWTPTAVLGLDSGVERITAGWGHTCALTTSGGVLCWGFNVFGQVGDGTTEAYRYTPTAVTGLGSGVAEISAGWGHTSALTQGGGVLAWGLNSNGQLGDATTTNRLTPTPTAGLSGVARAFDFDGDGKSDILWRHATYGDVWLWPMDGAARTAETYVRTVADTNWEIRGVADFDGDGKADIVWRHKTTGEIYLWPMDGSMVLSETYVARVDPAYDIVGAGDFDADGKSDILWRHLTNGEVWIWLMDGATPLSRVYVGKVDPAYVIKGVGDLDGDGQADIVWHHATVGEVWVWLMDGTTRLSATWVGRVADVGYQIVGVADYDGDGKADILWRHETAGQVWLWTMDGATRLAETWVGTVPDTNYRIVGTGDHDGDGKADILWHHATNGEVWVWLMDGATRLSETWVATVSEVGYQIVNVK